MQISPDNLYLDGGVLANLCVADEVAQILSALPYRCVLQPDMLSRRYPINDANPATAETNINEDANGRYVEVRTLVDSGMLHMCPAWDSEHVRLVVDLSDRCSDRIAHLVAWALLCGGAIGSDDLRTKRLTEEHFPEIKLVTTPHLIQTWQRTYDISDDNVTLVIKQIRHRAFFSPPESDPFRDWWLRHLDDL
jgi:hypothetical protein